MKWCRLARIRTALAMLLDYTYNARCGWSRHEMALSRGHIPRPRQDSVGDQKGTLRLSLPPVRSISDWPTGGCPPGIHDLNGGAPCSPQYVTSESAGHCVACGVFSGRLDDAKMKVKVDHRRMSLRDVLHITPDVSVHRHQCLPSPLRRHLATLPLCRP